MGTFFDTTSLLVVIVLLLLAGIGIFFFAVTRGALLVRAWIGTSKGPTAHVYPAYSEMWLITLIDFQPLISAILLFQYEKLVSRIVDELGQTVLAGKTVLVTSCAFGNVLSRVVRASIECGARRVIVVDIIKNELLHAARKLREFRKKTKFVEENAMHMQQESSSVAVNVIFFLLHELQDHRKEEVLQEAGRVVISGGKLILAEFHCPDALFMRMLSRIYFYVFEPYGLALWDSHDPVKLLECSGLWTCERTTYCFGNFQVIVATKR